MAVAVGVVDAVHRGQVFARIHAIQREDRRLAVVAAVPVAGEVGQGVRRVHQRIVFRRPFAVFDAADFFADGEHGVAEAVEFGQGFAFGRLYHQCAGDGEAHGRRVEAVVHQAFGDVINADASAVFVRADVDDAFVRDVAVGIAVKHVVRAFEAGGDVVGVQDGNLARFFQAVRPHPPQVHPRDDVHQRAAPRRGADRQSAAVFERHDAVAGQEGFQVFFDGDGANAGAAATVRDGEGFVQVQVGDVRAVEAGRGEADLRVEVGAVEVHLSAVAVDDGAEFADVALEDAVR